MSELMQLLTMTPHPLPMSAVRVQSFATPEDDIEVCYCPQCMRDDLTAEDFYIRPDGRLSSWCKCCTRQQSAQRRANKSTGSVS